MKIDDRVSAAEIDAQARRGLEALGKSLDVGADEETIRRADRTLEILKEGSTRDANEINRLGVQLKAAKILGLTAEQQRPFLDRLSGASGPPPIQIPKALATAPATTSRQKRPRK